MSFLSESLFICGTLLYDDVVQALTDQTFRPLPATPRGFARHGVVRDAQPVISEEWREFDF